MKTVNERILCNVADIQNTTGSLNQNDTIQVLNLNIIVLNMTDLHIITETNA